MEKFTNSNEELLEKRLQDIYETDGDNGNPRIPTWLMRETGNNESNEEGDSL